VSRPAHTAWRDLADGWAQFAAHSWIWLTTLQWSLLNLLTYAPYILLGPIMAERYLGGSRAWGIVIGLQAGGSVLMGLALVGRHARRPVRISVIGTVVIPLPCLLLALRAPLPAVAAAAFTAGAGITLSGTFWQTAMQQRVPAAMLARLTAFNTTGAFVLGSAGLAVVGSVAEAAGATRVLAFAAAWGLASGVAMCFVPAVTRVRWLDRAGPGDAEDESFAATGGGYLGAGQTE
jgi:hypothetical protein